MRFGGLKAESYPSRLRAVLRVNPLWLKSVQISVEAEAVRFRCPCCGYKTLETAGALALCPVCWWEDDGQEDEDAAEVRLTVNGQLSLDEARTHFALCGAAHPRFLPHVRKPLLSEL
jgi:Cysteine-rich CPCC